MEELPRDYSKVYFEDRPPLPPMRHSIATAAATATTTTSKPWGESDGVRTTKTHRETSVDLQAVVAKLKNLPEQRKYALDTMNQHFSSVFAERRNAERRKSPPNYKAYINYRDDNETYVVRVVHNTLKTIKSKLPRRGNYRYFFKNQLDNTCEEFESDDATVPYIEKDGQRQIYCQVFCQ